MVSFTLCADDYGLNSEVNNAINSLVHNGRLNAVSCMAVGNAFTATSLLEAVSEAPFPVEIGLHLTLTEYAPLSAMPKLTEEDMLPQVERLLIKSHLKRINCAEVCVELERQFDAFESAFGRKPDFVDGHQHVQIFPGIRDEVVNLVVSRMGPAGAGSGWVRCCDAPTSDLFLSPNLRSMLLAVMSRRQRARLARAGLRHNDRFYGVNTFDPAQSFRTLMQGWLQRVARREDHTLIMCHPGMAGSDPTDPIAVRRPDEYSYLASEDFMDDLERFEVELAPPAR